MTTTLRQATVVVPVHNEAANIPALVRAVREAAAIVPGWTVGILFVDDGSTDGSVAAIEALRAARHPVGYVKLTRNFGHQAALEAGMAAAEGDAIITMDGDLQHPPAEIPRMLAAADQGADVVQMVRDQPAKGSKGLFSRGFYVLIGLIAKTEITPNAADFRLVRRPVVEVLKRIPEREKFLRGLIPTLGFKQVTLSFREGDRVAGRPSFTLRKSFRMAGKAVFDFSTVPLRVVFWAGVLLAVLSFLAGVVQIIDKLIRAEAIVPGYTDIIVSILFLCGCILVSLGILGRYLILILEQVRGRPAYVVAAAVMPPPAPPSKGA